MTPHEQIFWMCWLGACVLGAYLYYFDEVDPNDGEDPEE